MDHQRILLLFLFKFKAYIFANTAVEKTERGT
jgi:hypothetical protein